MKRAQKDPTRPLVYGVLGGIAAGKSEVARVLAGPRGVVLDADRYAREALSEPGVRFEVLARFGGLVFAPDGSIDRALLAARVFADPEERRALESFTHPYVRDKIRAGLEAARAAGAERVVLDVPLLLENDAQHGLARLCDVLVYVDADRDARDARAVAQRGWQPGEVARREAAQMPLEEKRARAHHVIRNQGTLAELERDAARVIAATER